MPYWFDANGRYENKETLLRLLEHAKAVGAFDQILVVEEPFPEDYRVNVSDVGVRIMADESAHTDDDVRERIEMGYGAIALKAIAKTLSMTMKMAQVAHEHGVPCTCADLTVNPILVDWNLNVAARLAPLPGFDIGLMEANGHQHYLHWDRMQSYRADSRATGRDASDSMFMLDEEFYNTSGGIFSPLPHYDAMFDR
jgi:L-alanine-DL-glutamate epimerase-like enolase superfamily enzyme